MAFCRNKIVNRYASLIMISVCMTTYNGARYLKEQIDSILHQLGEDDELIISDDESEDSTLLLINDYEDKRIRIFHHKKKQQKYIFSYTTKNFESALNNARGDIIFLSDQDDVWLDGKIEKMVQKLETCDIVLSDCSYTDANLNILVPSKINFENIKIGAIRNLYKCGYLGSCLAFRRRILDSALPFPEDVPHDLWIGLVGGYIGNFSILHNITMLYRRHDTNVSATNNDLLTLKSINPSSVPLSRNKNSLSYKLRYRVIVVVNFIKFIAKYHSQHKLVSHLEDGKHRRI